MKIFLNLTRLLVLIVLFSACSGEEEEPTPSFDALEGFSDYEKEVVRYFREIALGFEFGDASRITRKWTGPMRIFVSGEPTPAHLSELDEIVNEINDLATDDFEMMVIEDSLQANYHIFIGSYQEYQRIVPVQFTLIYNNWGLFTVWWDENQDLVSGQMYVDTERPDATAQLHLLREELTQSVGLARDSRTYRNSIFQAEWTTVTQYEEIDRDLIRVLYHPKMVSGLDHNSVLEVLKEIFEEEGI